MKFMHFCGVRLGLHSESGRPWGMERLDEVAGTLRRAAETAENEKIDLVLISGDLFAHRPVTTELDEANRIFAAAPGVQFVIIAGESDILKKNSPVMSFDWCENVRYVVSEKTEKICFPKLSTVVYALSRSAGGMGTEEMIAEAESDSDPVNIRLALVYEPELEKAGAFSGTGFSYAALGGRGSKREAVFNKAYYSGRLEPDGMTDSGIHGYYKGEISEVTGALLSLEFVPFAGASYVPLLVKVNVSTTEEQLSAIIENEIKKRGTSNIYRIRITGKKKPETVFALTEIRDRYRIAEFLEEAEPQYDFEALFDAHSQDMIGYFISTLRTNRAELPEMDKKAMFYGIDALIKTAEKETERE